MERVACDLCRSDQTQAVHAWPGDLEWGPAAFSLVRCISCGLMYLNPRPTAVELERIYSEAYWDRRFPDDLENHKLYNAPWREVMRGRAAPLRRIQPSGRILEVGSGMGLFLKYMKEEGWDVSGVEIGKPAWEYSTGKLGLAVQCGSLEDYRWDGAPFDVVWFWHSLEHLSSPVRAIEIARRMLAPGGVVVVSVPNAGGLDCRLFGGSWFGWMPPVHLYHFTPSSLRLLMEKGGLPLVRVIHYSQEGNYSQFYSESLRLFFREKIRRTVPPATKVESRSDPTTPKTHASHDMFRGGGRWVDLAHAVEYATLKQVGVLLSRLGRGAMMTAIAGNRVHARIPG